MLCTLAGSRKGSKERNQYSENEPDWSKMIRGEDGKFLKRSITSDTMSSGKGSSDSDKLSGDKTSRKGSSGDSEKGDDVYNKLSTGTPKANNFYNNKNKYEYRRKSLAVVEKPRLSEHWQHSRRSSVSNAMEKNNKRENVVVAPPQKPLPLTVTSIEIVKVVQDEKKNKLKDDESILSNALNETRTGDNRYSREFETSCWGLQNLKKDTTTFNHQNQTVVINSILKNSLQSSVSSKSEDNLVITTSKKKTTGNSLANNLNASKTEESIEKQFSGKGGGGGG